MTTTTAINRNLSKAERTKLKMERKKVIAEFNKAKNAKIATEKQAKAEARAAKRNPPIILSIEELTMAAKAKLEAANQNFQEAKLIDGFDVNGKEAVYLKACAEELAYIDVIQAQRQEAAFAALQAQAAKRAAMELRDERRVVNREKQIAHQIASKVATRNRRVQKALKRNLFVDTEYLQKQAA